MLSDEQRAALCVERDKQGNELRELGARRDAADQARRWHGDRRRLRGQETMAETDLRAAQARAFSISHGGVRDWSQAGCLIQRATTWWARPTPLASCRRLLAVTLSPCHPKKDGNENRSNLGRV